MIQPMIRGLCANATSTEAPSLFTPELFDGTESLDIVVAGAEKSPEMTGA